MSSSIGGFTSLHNNSGSSHHPGEDNTQNAFVIGASLTAIIIVLVLLRFVINVLIDVVIVRDIDAARNRCSNVSSSRCGIWLLWFGGCCFRRRIPPVVPSNDINMNYNNNTLTDTDGAHSELDDLEDEDDDDSSSSSSSGSNGSYTPTLEFSTTLQQLQQHYQQHLDSDKTDHHPQGDTNSSSRSTASANDSLTSTSSSSNSRCGIRTDPETMLKQYMEALLPSTIVTNEWMSSIVMKPTTRSSHNSITTHSNDHNCNVTTNTIVPVLLPDHHLIDTELGQVAEDAMILSSSVENRISPPPPSSSSSSLAVVVNMDDSSETVSPDGTTHQQHSLGDEEDGMAASSSSHLPTCSICLQELSTGQSIYTVDTCQHYFHSTCLQEWILQPIVVAQRRRQRRRRHQQQQQQRRRRPSRRLLRSCTSNNHCPNCRTPIIVPESKLEDVLHFVFTSPSPPPPPQPSQL